MPNHRATDAKDLFDIDLNHKYLFFRRTKIVATIGPSSSSPDMLKRLIAKGLNVARINFSHGNPRDHLATIREIRSVAERQGTSVAILADLCGPKIRVGMFKNGEIQLRDRAIVTVTTASVTGDDGLIPSQYEGLVREVRIGERILLDDGNLELEVTKKLKDHIKARVIRGGVLKNKKGMNLPDTRLHVSALTEKDKSDALYCIKGMVDYIALSFVRKARDVTDLKDLLAAHGAAIPVIAKIEKPEALHNIHGIMELADGIMVARGDLGVELPAKKVPVIQSKLIELANRHNKPVIVATQMLESMIDHSRPTRAEVTDVSGACMSGADAVMLSAETAAGKYPLEAVEAMDSILREAEAYQFFALGGKFMQAAHDQGDPLENAIGAATAQLSRELKVRAIFVLTRSGATARIISSDRPAAPVLALTHSETVVRRLHLLWGVYPFLVKKTLTTKEYLARAESIMRELHLAKTGDHLIMLSSLGDRGIGTNSIVMHRMS